MLSFQPLTLDAAPIIRPYFSLQASRFCDATPGVALMWRNHFETAYVIDEDTLAFRVKLNIDRYAYTLPIGKHPERLLSAIESGCDSAKPWTLCNISEQVLPTVRQRYPAASVTFDRDWSDYLYESASFREFRGNRFHGQRNHVNKFKRLFPTARLVDLDSSRLEQAAAFVVWHAQQYPKSDNLAISEQAAIIEVLSHYDTYALQGALLMVEDRIVALSLGEVINDTLYIHVEKADTAYPGAYPAMASAFAQRYTNEHIPYINREEDVGDEGLRISKTSYHPLALLNKYIVTIPPQR